MATISAVLGIRPFAILAPPFVLSTVIPAKLSTTKSLAQSPNFIPFKSSWVLIDRFDQDANGWVYPSTVDESALPTIQIGLGASDSEQLFNIYPGDLNFSPAETGYPFHAPGIIVDLWSDGSLEAFKIGVIKTSISSVMSFSRISTRY
jgi:hypothetical protein